MAVPDMSQPSRDAPKSTAHQAMVTDQFTRQAALFAEAPALHDAASLAMLVDAARPQATDTSLDVACGPGTVVAAFARHVRHATGLDATDAMLDQARKFAAARDLGNVAWRRGDVRALPCEDRAFDVVSCRFAFHHFEQPAAAFAEMARVCRPGGRIVLCDAVVSDDPRKAAAFNDMERYRDPSTVEFRTVSYLAALFGAAGLPQPAATFYRLPVEMESVLKTSFPAGGDHDGVRAMLREAVDGDRMGIGARRHGDTIRFAYSVVILVATKP